MSSHGHAEGKKKAKAKAGRHRDDDPLGIEAACNDDYDPWASIAEAKKRQAEEAAGKTPAPQTKASQPAARKEPDPDDRDRFSYQDDTQIEAADREDRDKPADRDC
eukprot:TRINITY_DN14725_c0_g1_i1.p2 TRINITY_DN14725_c0_g1~~TRINITY_DN14725_c0_g1_i1.p2  ORF type:complete len:106 (+),score=33.21 TRINITY_DN14725_c0_g1_i1:74-391(+)